MGKPAVKYLIYREDEGMHDETLANLYRRKIIAIVRGVKYDRILPFASALYDGGIRIIEVTFNQAYKDSWPGTVNAIEQIRRQFDGSMSVGAGTVLSTEQTQLAFEAGADFIVSPNTDKSVIEKTRELGMCSFPGAFTASEIVSAHEYGADAVKAFPASILGPGYFKALQSPLAHIKLLAVGGINENNIAEYLRAGAAGAGVGGNLTRQEYINNNEFEKITCMAGEYIKAVHELK